MKARPHHYMNADGTCHAGDLFEQGTDYVVLYTAEELVRIVNAEKAEAWDEALAAVTRGVRGAKDAHAAKGHRDTVSALVGLELAIPRTENPYRAPASGGSL